MRAQTISIFTILALAACDMSEVPEDKTVETALVDFGDGEEEITYEVDDGLAIFQEDIILGPVEWVRDGGFRMKKTNPDPDAPVAASVLAHLDAWPDGRVPFRIDNGDFPIGSTMRNRIQSAINHWNSTTLVNLVPAVGNEHHVVFEFVANVCRSSVGYLSDFGPQKIQLTSPRRGQSGCSTGSIIHEIGHTVGFHHEHTRADRDSKVVINWDNIRAGAEGNFLTFVANGFIGSDYGPYDSGSVMHYGSFAFAVDPTIPTIVRSGCDPNASNLPASCLITANRTALSELDRKAATRQVTGEPTGFFSSFRLRNEANNGCLRPRGGSTVTGADIITSSCNNAASRRWYTWDRPGMTGSVLINVGSKLCAQRAASGNGMVQMPCTGSSSQRFHFESGGFLRGDLIRRSGTQECLRRISSQSQTILSSRCNNTTSRRWVREY